MNSTSPFVRRILLMVAVVSGMVSGSPTAQASHHHQAARLIVQRTPNFGTNLIVHLSIDGRTVADIPRSQSYEGFLSPGRHLLTVVGLPNVDHRQPTRTRVVVQSGHTYVYTAAWESDRGVILHRSAESNDTTRLR